MIKWNWIYRDFVKAYQNCYSEGEWRRVFNKYYFSQNKKLLSEIYFKPKGFSIQESIFDRLAQLNKSYYSELIINVGDLDCFEITIKEMTNKVLKALKLGEEEINAEIYVIVGLNSTTIYSTEYEGKKVTVICLESVNGNIDGIQLLLAHECNHWMRQKAFRHDIFEHCVGERIVTEGLACAFSEEVCPNKSIAEYCIVPENTVRWTIENIQKLDDIITSQLNVNKLITQLFFRSPLEPLMRRMPPRIGYVYGYLKVKEYLDRSNLSITDVTTLDWQKVLL